MRTANATLNAVDLDGCRPIQRLDLGRSPSDPVQVQFLQLLCAQPDADALAYAMTEGPGSRVGAVSSGIFLVDVERKHLVLAGLYGIDDEPFARYLSIPLDVDLPLNHAFHSGEAILVSGSKEDSVYPLSRAFFEARPSQRDLDFMHLPLAYLGIGLGAIYIGCQANQPWDWTQRAHLSGIASAVSLWARITTGLPHRATTTRARTGRRGSIALTPRQRQVLDGIHRGMSNKEIARELGYSTSTVKSEVQEILACLGANDRRDAIIKARLAGISWPDDEHPSSDIANPSGDIANPSSDIDMPVPGQGNGQHG